MATKICYRLNNFDGSHRGGGAKHHFSKNAKIGILSLKRKGSRGSTENLFFFAEVVCTSFYEDFRDINPKLWFPQTGSSGQSHQELQHDKLVDDSFFRFATGNEIPECQLTRFFIRVN